MALTYAGGRRPQLLGDDRLLPAGVRFPYVATLSFLIYNLPGVEGIAQHVGDGVLGEAPPGAGAMAVVVEEVGDLLEGVAAAGVAFEHQAHGCGFLLWD